MYPYCVKFKDSKGRRQVRQVQTIDEGQRLALEHTDGPYCIKDRGGIAVYQFSTSILRGVA